MQLNIGYSQLNGILSQNNFEVVTGLKIKDRESQKYTLGSGYQFVYRYNYEPVNLCSHMELDNVQFTHIHSHLDCQSVLEQTIF